MTAQNFFEETTDQSEVKRTIVLKYFLAWAKVIMAVVRKHDKRIAYVDLFAGPGCYKDGANSTPLLILEQAVADKDLRQMLVTVFNDRDAQNARLLHESIVSIPGIETLKHKPRVYNSEVGEKLAHIFEDMRLVPTLLFVDPWGYKGLSLRLVGSVLKDWGCDCIFFFNYNRINAGLENPFVREHMYALFGRERAEQLGEELESLDPAQRELLVVEELAEALRDLGGKFVLPFCFRNDRGSRTSHHLIFVSKAFRGYEIMKEIMAKESTTADQGVPSFQYNPADARYPMLFELSRPLDDLESALQKEFAGRTLTVSKIYEYHSVGKRYILKNYKDVLKKLEAAGRILTDPPADKRQKRKGEPTMADSVRVTFPGIED
ncbi:MAG: three-Cys-motif partner protein TcmP [Candidatus Lindowbacteria bacterium]|nr:three-Cys-motif partner protein TcmP [Candidatus Lindowbacteria bacterium]